MRLWVRDQLNDVSQYCGNMWRRLGGVGWCIKEKSESTAKKSPKKFRLKPNSVFIYFRFCSLAKLHASFIFSPTIFNEARSFRFANQIRFCWLIQAPGAPCIAFHRLSAPNRKVFFFLSFFNWIERATISFSLRPFSFYLMVMNCIIKSEKKSECLYENVDHMWKACKQTEKKAGQLWALTTHE